MVTCTLRRRSTASSLTCSASGRFVHILDQSPALTARSSSSLSCMNEYLPVDSGGYLCSEIGSGKDVHYIREFVIFVFVISVNTNNGKDREKICM